MLLGSLRTRRVMHTIAHRDLALYDHPLLDELQCVPGGAEDVGHLCLMHYAVAVRHCPELAGGGDPSVTYCLNASGFLYLEKYTGPVPHLQPSGQLLDTVCSNLLCQQTQLSCMFEVCKGHAAGWL